MPIPPGGPSQYNQNFYLDRHQPEKQFDDWIQTSRKNTCWLTGPPGCGKSWLFSRIRGKYNRSNFPVFFLDNLTELFVIEDNKPDLNRDKVVNIIAGFYRQAKTKHKNSHKKVVTFTEADDPGQSIARLAGWLAEFDLPCALLLVDGFDEMPLDASQEECQDILVDKLLNKFIVHNQEQRTVAVALSQRTYTKRYNYTLSDDPCLIEMSAPVTAWEQFDRIQTGGGFGAKAPVSQADFDAWRVLLSNYQWENAFANHYLFACGMDSPVPGLRPLTGIDLAACARDLLERPDHLIGFPAIDRSEFEMLCEVAHLDPLFPTTDLDRAIRRCTPESKYTRFNHPFIQDLRSLYGVLYADPVQRTLLTLDSALRALLRDHRLLL